MSLKKRKRTPQSQRCHGEKNHRKTGSLQSPLAVNRNIWHHSGFWTQGGHPPHFQNHGVTSPTCCRPHTVTSSRTVAIIKEVLGSSLCYCPPYPSLSRATHSSMQIFHFYASMKVKSICRHTQKRICSRMSIFLGNRLKNMPPGWGCSMP